MSSVIRPKSTNDVWHKPAIRTSVRKTEIRSLTIEWAVTNLIKDGERLKRVAQLLHRAHQVLRNDEQSIIIDGNALCQVQLAEGRYPF